MKVRAWVGMVWRCECVQGGYKDFFQAYPHLCEPRAMVSMRDEAFAGALAAEERRVNMEWR